MKIVVIGGSGLIGSKLVDRLRGHGHEVVAASPASGVDTLTGVGLAAAISGAQTVVDVSNSPSFEDAAALEFFTMSTRNQLAAEADVGVTHHVALSVVGTDRLAESGYFRAKIAQEELIEQSRIPFSILHVTQFFEFLDRMADAATEGDTVRLPPVLIQPIASDDVADALCDVVLASPINGMVEVGGPEQLRFDELMREVLDDRNDPRQVVTDPDARYFGAVLDQRTLVPDNGARRTETRLKDWLNV
ncbi:MAG TPA: SDR family oxidoreductase [Nocardioidaceae bacterium]|nr:SDR family oxidoreductase [Nocardioidaceae bacterium]